MEGRPRPPLHANRKEALINLADILRGGHRTQTPAHSPRPARPRLAEGIELIGEYKGSGFREAPYLVRRGDGQVMQISRLLYLVAEAADGERDLAAIASAVGAQVGQQLSAANVAFLVEQKLRPAGVIASDRTAELPRASSPLAFTARQAVVPPRVVGKLAFWLQPLFWPLLQGLLLGWFVVVDGWIFFRHGVSPAIAAVLSQPILLLGLFALAALSTLFHELGHATACRYGGARPGAMGIGLYLVWPAVFTDVTDAYRLDRAGRLRTDLGGVYFNALFALGAFAVYLRTGFEPLLALILVEHLLILQQLMPWVRLDGYYVLTDLVGVPDILSRVRPLLASLVPGRPASTRVTELKPWVRVVATVYVITLVPLLAFVYALMLIHAPGMFVRAAHSSAQVYGRLESAFGAGRWVDVALDAVQLLALVLPVLGVSFVVLQTVRALGRRLAPQLRLAAVFAAGVAVALLVGHSWSGDSRNGVARAADRAVGVHRNAERRPAAASPPAASSAALVTVRPSPPRTALGTGPVAATTRAAAKTRRTARAAGPATTATPAATAGTTAATTGGTAATTNAVGTTAATTTPPPPPTTQATTTEATTTAAPTTTTDATTTTTPATTTATTP